MRRAWTGSGALMLFVGLGVFAALPAWGQVTIPTSTTSTTQRPTTTTTRPSGQSTTTQPSGQTTTTAPKRPATTAPPATAPQRTTTTIPTPAPSPSTTAAPVPVSKHSGHFSPVFTVLSVMGMIGGLGLLVLQWFLTRPGRAGWTL